MWFVLMRYERGSGELEWVVNSGPFRTEEEAGDAAKKHARDEGDRTLAVVSVRAGCRQMEPTPPPVVMLSPQELYNEEEY